MWCWGIKVNKQTNKQRAGMCGGTDTRGSAMSHSPCRVWYVVCQSTQQGFGVDWSCVELSVWGCTLIALDLLSVLSDRNWTWFQGWYSTLSIVSKFSTPYLGGAGSTPGILHAESPNHCSALNLLTKTAADAINPTVVVLMCHLLAITLF